MRLKIKVIPNARKNEVLQEGEILKIKVIAPANEEVKQRSY